MRQKKISLNKRLIFCGGALGSWLGTFLWGTFGWIGVCGAGVVFQTIAATIHILGIKHR